MAALKVWKQEFMPEYDYHMFGNDEHNQDSTQTPAQDGETSNNPNDVA